MLLAFLVEDEELAIFNSSEMTLIGAVLMQTEENKRHVIAYASRVLTAAKSKYSVTHLEAFTVAWALKHFRDIIFGYPITVYTGQTAVTELFHGKNFTGRLAR